MSASTSPGFNRIVALLATVSLAPLGCADQTGSEALSPNVWVVEEPPALVIGSETTSPESALNVVSDATRLSDGRIAVANGGLESRLLLFSEDGQYLSTIGRNGEGPGEYEWITSVQAGPGDSLYVFDAALQRLTVFAPGGDVRTVPHRASTGGAGERLRVVTRLLSDVWAVKGLENPMFGDLTEILQDTVVVGILDERLEDFELLQRVPGLMSMTFEVGGRSAFGGAAFSPHVLQAAIGRCVFVVPAQAPRVLTYSVSGDLLHEISTVGEASRVSEDLKRDWIDDRLGMTEPHEREVFLRALQDIPWVGELPLFNQLVADQWGRLWLQAYEPPTGLGPLWHLYSPTGEHLGDVQLPTAITVFEIAEHGVLGMTRGDFDEEMVVLQPLGPVPVPNQVYSPCGD